MKTFRSSNCKIGHTTSTLSHKFTMHLKQVAIAIHYTPQPSVDRVDRKTVKEYIFFHNRTFVSHRGLIIDYRLIIEDCRFANTNLNTIKIWGKGIASTKTSGSPLKVSYRAHINSLS